MKEKNNIIYFDNAATTKPSNEVVALFVDLETKCFGNSSSIHGLGAESQAYLTRAKDMILKSFNLKDYRVTFTSGATEANNIAIKGYAHRYLNRGKHLITTNIEHPSVLECFKSLEKEGFDVTYLPANKEGVVTSEQVRQAMRGDTILVSIMSTNNELGSKNDITSISKVVHEFPKAKFHSDTTQSIGKDSINYSMIDMFVLSGHKIHGLKGSGCLISKSSITLDPIVNGGGQEDGLRSGTVAVALACSLAKSISLAQEKISVNLNKITEIHQQIVDNLQNIEGIKINSTSAVSPYILNFSLTNKKASVIVEALSNKGIYVSSVSACNSKHEASSYVIKNVTGDDKLAANTIRISLSGENTLQEAEIFVNTLKEVMGAIR